MIIESLNDPRWFAAAVGCGVLAVAGCSPAAVGAPRGRPDTIAVAGGEIEVEIDSGHLDRSRAEIMSWISAGASAVVAYYGRFPVSHFRLVIEPVAGEAGVLSGTTWADGGAHARIHVGEHTTQGQLARDWVMTHEMIHTAFPDQPPEHHWIEEGIATYTEPLARSWVGRYPPARVWTDLVRGLPNGLPRDGDRGLDHTDSWGRTYWGGALFCLLADIEIRERTDGRRGFVDAMRGLLAAGGNDQAPWSIDHAFDAADQAVGVPVLRELYARMKDEPVAPDLEALWRSLGISMRQGELVLDDQAPKAAIRRAISAALAAPDR